MRTLIIAPRHQEKTLTNAPEVRVDGVRKQIFGAQ